MLPDAPAVLRDRVARMRRRAFELQASAGAATEVEDPIEADPGALGGLRIPALVAAGERDMPDFRFGAEALARQLRHPRCHQRTRHLAPLEEPEAFDALLLGFLRESAAGEGTGLSTPSLDRA